MKRRGDYKSQRYIRFSSLCAGRWCRNREQEAVLDVMESERVSEIEVGRISDPAHAEESEAADLMSEDPQTSSDTDDTDIETPPKKRRLDPNFLLDTPERRCLGEYPAISSSLFLGQTSQLRAFANQVNATSVCAIPCCSGKLKPVSVTLAGLGGAL